MEVKKSEKADLERKRFIFLEVGLIIALGLVLFGFEAKTYEHKNLEGIERTVEIVEEEMIEITQQEVVQPEIQAPQVTTIINEVDDNVEVVDNIVIDIEADEKTTYEEYKPVAVKQEVVEEEEEIFIIVETPPEFPGGEASRLKFISENIKYPQMARELGISGTVYVEFVVGKDGKISDVKVVRGIGGNCDEEAIRVVKMFPNWKAGKQRGKAVPVRFRMPIKFTLAG